MIYLNSLINPSIILRKRKSSPFIDQLAQGLLMHGDANYQQEFHLVIVAATIKRHLSREKSISVEGF
jgi:hypothetical protein